MVRIIKKILLLLLSQTLLTSGLFSQGISYYEFYKIVDNLEANGNYLEARELAKNNIDKFPERWFEISKEIIYINEKLGNYTENLELFNRAHAKGFFYFLHPRMPKYIPYKDFLEFDTISKIDLLLREEALEISKTTYKIQLPDGFKEDKSYPAIFIFHGGGKNISDAIQHWQVSSLNQEYVKIYLQSYRHFDFNTFGWGTNDPRLDSDIEKIFREISATYPIDTTEILVGGISAGASAAIDISLRGVIPINGFIAYCPDIPPFMKDRNFSLIKNTNTVGYISSGEKDHFLPRQEKMIKLLDSLGYHTNLLVDSARGHEYPENEEETVTNAIHFINLNLKP